MMIQIKILVVATVWDGFILFLPRLLRLVPPCCAVIGFEYQSCDFHNEAEGIKNKEKKIQK